MEGRQHTYDLPRRQLLHKFQRPLEWQWAGKPPQIMLQHGGRAVLAGHCTRRKSKHAAIAAGLPT